MDVASVRGQWAAECGGLCRMDALQASFSLSVFFLTFVACLLGGMGITALRLGDRPAWRSVGWLVFFLCLGTQGMLAMLAMVCNSNSWLVFGSVLTAMSVGATLDLGGDSSASIS